MQLLGEKPPLLGEETRPRPRLGEEIRPLLGGIQRLHGELVPRSRIPKTMPNQTHG